jgi:segregation and condensation protein A
MDDRPAEAAGDDRAKDGDTKDDKIKDGAKEEKA